MIGQRNTVSFKQASSFLHHVHDRAHGGGGFGFGRDGSLSELLCLSFGCDGSLDEFLSLSGLSFFGVLVALAVVMRFAMSGVVVVVSASSAGLFGDVFGVILGINYNFLEILISLLYSNLYN